MCCVEYQVCAAYNGIALTDVLTAISESGGEAGGDLGNWNEGWSIDMMLAPYIITTIQSNIGMVDSQCSSDYVEIPCIYLYIFCYINFIKFIIKPMVIFTYFSSEIIKNLILHYVQ